jgi:hypothetical protein
LKRCMANSVACRFSAVSTWNLSAISPH